MSTKKVKYYERDMFSDESNNRDSLLKRTTNGKNDFIENENELIMPSNSDGNTKNLFEYEELNQDSYNTPLKISQINIRKQFSNYHGHHIGPGKGFGNLGVSNDIRHGSSTRLDNTQIKINKEKEINSRYDLIDRDFQNPHNLILPFARGGEITRKSLKEESEVHADDNEDPNSMDNNNQISKYRFTY